MNILVVDDKVDVVRGIVNGVHWNEIGNMNLFQAYSGIQALEIMQKELIHLLITDIEMPGIDGLELSSKVRDLYPDIGIIFLTSHDSFRYAQTAIRLGCCDYILQPVDYAVLQNSIIAVINNMLLKKNGASTGEGWMQLDRDQAWKKIIFSNPAYNEQQMREILENTGVFLEKNALYREILVTMTWKRVRVEGMRHYRTEDVLINNVEDTLKKGTDIVYQGLVEDNQWLLIVTNSDVIPYLQFLVGNTKQEGGDYAIVIYVSDPAPFGQLASVFRQLQKNHEENVEEYPGVYEINTHKTAEPSIRCDTLSIQKWKSWNAEENGNLVKDEIVLFLRHKNDSHEVNRSLLALLAQMITVAFTEPDGNENEFSTVRSDEYVHATDSTEDLLKYLDSIMEIAATRNQKPYESNGENYLAKIKGYVEDHIGDKLTREEIASKFFLSKDYISHLFTKYESESFLKYVTERKMEKAKEMLRDTRLPVKVIASSVGMDDFAYFCRVFKNMAGMSAAEYRNRSSSDSR